MKRNKAAWIGAFVLGLGALFAGLTLSLGPRGDENQKAMLSVETVDEGAGEFIPEPIFPHMIPPRKSLYEALRELNVPSHTILEIVEAAEPVINLNQLRAGTQFRLEHQTDPSSDLTAIEFRISPIERLFIDKAVGTWNAERQEEVVESKIVSFGGTVLSTLWESAEVAKMDPELIVELAEIFAWQVDFAREVRSGDRWRLTVEQNLVRGRAIGWGRILAAEYENAGEVHKAVLFRNGEHSAYYGADGSSLKRMFLKSPIKYGRISSRFQRRRFHPIFKIHRPHLGVDYAAPTGTPIRAVGDGTVTMASWGGGGGNTVRIRHNGTYQTAYMHMSRFAKGLRRGSRVQQGQVIGYVGSTGASTGPHLHFEFVYNGKIVDPLKQKFPTAEPIPAELISTFQAQAAESLAMLADWRSFESPSAGASVLLEPFAPHKAHAESAKPQ